MKCTIYTADGRGTTCVADDVSYQELCAEIITMNDKGWFSLTRDDGFTVWIRVKYITGIVEVEE